MIVPGTVLEGTWYVGWGENTMSKLTALTPGSFYTEPAGVAHSSQHFDGEAIVQVTGTWGRRKSITSIRHTSPRNKQASGDRRSRGQNTEYFFNCSDSLTSEPLGSDCLVEGISTMLLAEVSSEPRLFPRRDRAASLGAVPLRSFTAVTNIIIKLR